MGTVDYKFGKASRQEPIECPKTMHPLSGCFASKPRCLGFRVYGLGFKV